MRPPFKWDGQDDRGASVAALLRFAVLAAVATIVVIAIGESLRTPDAGVTVQPTMASSHPLASALARCRDVTAEQLATDDTCRRVWAENRKRFFTPNRPVEAR